MAEDRTHLKPSDVEPYHAKARQVIEAWPKTIADGGWTSKDDQLPKSAEQLLHPNCSLSRVYTSDVLRPGGRPAQASLLIVQCRDARDMSGHYPPICYPAGGHPPIGDPQGQPFTVQFGNMTVSGKEYVFLESPLPVMRQCVYDFFIVPGSGCQPDMDGVRRTAGDYQKRYYGAAQFQVVMDADYPQDDRMTIFRQIIGANARALSVLNTVEVK